MSGGAKGQRRPTYDSLMSDRKSIIKAANLAVVADVGINYQGYQALTNLLRTELFSRPIFIAIFLC
jgi:hypothetical protein